MTDLSKSQKRNIRKIRSKLNSAHIRRIIEHLTNFERDCNRSFVDEIEDVKRIVKDVVIAGKTVAKKEMEREFIVSRCEDIRIACYRNGNIHAFQMEVDTRYEDYENEQDWQPLVDICDTVAFRDLMIRV
eukprot:NODE_670_length_4858_cov_0.883379.p3 type:complete len:130 gc:universal NODE_670_length_4858_cov_0.883379:171-560(+)